MSEINAENPVSPANEENTAGAAPAEEHKSAENQPEETTPEGQQPAGGENAADKKQVPVPESLLTGSFLAQISNLSQNTLPDGCPEGVSFEAALFAWAEKAVPADQQSLFRSMFSVEALKKAFGDGRTGCSFEFDDASDSTLSRRLAMHLLSDEDTGDVLCVSSLKSFPRPEPTETGGGGTPADSSPFRAVIRSYRLFFAVDPDQPRIVKSAVYRDEDRLVSSVSMPCPYRAFMKAVAGKYIRSAWEDEFMSFTSLDHLREASGRKESTLRQTFSADGGPIELDIWLPEEGSEDKRCYLGVGSPEGSSENGLTVTARDSEAMHAALEDLHMEMQMEREETRKKHRRGSFLLALFMIVVGVVGGAVLQQRIPAFSSIVDRFLPLPAEEVPAETPPPAEDVEVVIPETIVTYIPFTQVSEFKADLLENGLPRVNVSDANYETIDFSLSVKELLDAAWFETQYAKKGYSLDGTEGGLALALRFTAGEKIDSVVPQESLPLKLVDADGNPLTAYQLMDQPMGGSYNVKIAADTDSEIYKRCEKLSDARYLVLSCYQDGARHDLYFSLRYDDPNVDYEGLKMGDRGDLVQAMKQKLASLGYLSERSALNNQYNAETANAVSAAQESFGLEKTGVADTAFLKTLFGK